MLSKIVLAGAMLAALTTSGIAATNHRGDQPAAPRGAWVVLQDAGGGACYVADRPAGLDEGQLSHAFATESQALAALGSIAACESVNIEHDKDGGQNNAT